MNRWRCFRIVRVGAALLAPVLGFAWESATAGDSARSTVPTPVLPPRMEIPCAMCGTRWQLPPLVTQRPIASASRVPMVYRFPANAARLETAALDASRRPDVIRDLTFRDNQPLINRLKRLQALPFVTVWDSTAATVYVGVNRDGEPGLHLRQKKHDRGTLLPAGRALFADAAPWRSAAFAAPRRSR